MNLTPMAYQGQWNQAQVVRSPAVYADFLGIFRQVRLGRPGPSLPRVRGPAASSISSSPFRGPRRPMTRGDADPQPGQLKRRHAGGTRRDRTRIRIIQYAMYGDRGHMDREEARYLWNAAVTSASSTR